ncbi:MAG: nitroreductase family protein [Candidatus Omnitrophota bacterium]
MEFFEVICSRASIREYQDKSINDEMLEKLVDAGRRAPTARAIEPWEFVAVKNKNTLKTLGEIVVNGYFLKTAAAAIIIFSKNTKYYLEDSCAATENILLTAAALGLGACWIAGDKKDYAQNIKQIFKAQDELKLVSLISLGWPKVPVKQNKKRSLRDVLHWETF